MTGKQKTMIAIFSVLAVMTTLAASAVPLYNWFCRVTGFAGETSTATSGSDVILDQIVTIRFDASLDSTMPWEFKPLQREMKLRIGETGLAFFEAYNPTDRVVAGTASYNVTPFTAGYYFVKIQCFCFTQQVLQPGERAEMPVTFFVDPAIVDDPDAKFAHRITLSYTFHETALPEEQLGLYQNDVPSDKTVPNEG